MSSCDRRTFVLKALAFGAPVILGGCFKPMLAEDNSAVKIRGRVAYPATDGRFGYFLNKTLTDRLGKAEETEWTLNVTHLIREQKVAVATDNSVTRITLSVETDWSLRQRSNGAIVLQDTARSQAGYSATTSLFATRQTRQDVERRLARDIGERISRRIYASAEKLAG